MPMDFKGLLLDMVPHISCVFQMEVVFTVETPVTHVEGVKARRFICFVSFEIISSNLEAP